MENKRNNVLKEWLVNKDPSLALAETKTEREGLKSRYTEEENLKSKYVDLKDGCLKYCSQKISPLIGGVPFRACAVWHHRTWQRI